MPWLYRCYWGNILTCVTCNKRSLLPFTFTHCLQQRKSDTSQQINHTGKYKQTKWITISQASSICLCGNAKHGGAHCSHFRGKNGLSLDRGGGKVGGFRHGILIRERAKQCRWAIKGQGVSQVHGGCSRPLSQSVNGKHSSGMVEYPFSNIQEFSCKTPNKIHASDMAGTPVYNGKGLPPHLPQTHSTEEGSLSFAD